MSDLNWCTFCDNAINTYSDSLYCSENCLRSDALRHHPLLGYDYAELKDFPRSATSPTLTATSASSNSTVSPLLSPIPSFKELPAFNLNGEDESLYQHIYTLPKQHNHKKNNIKKSPISLEQVFLN